MNKIIVILGPTSSGKSDIAIKLGKKFNGEIISADSRQIYRGMDIGTGKVKRDYRSREIPSAVEGSHGKKTLKKRFDLEEFPDGQSGKGKVEPWIAQGIPHHLIDIVSPRTIFNVAKFKKRAENIIADILRRSKLPIICGGTGFWIQAVVDDVVFPEVKPDSKLRKKLEKYSMERLLTILKKMDPERAKNIDQKNKVRLIRAIEICKAIGSVPSIRNPQISNLPPKARLAKGGNSQISFLQIGLRLPKEKLYRNIEKRVLARFKQGMIREVEKLHAGGLSLKKIQSFGLAYFWIPLYLQKKISKQDLIEKIIQAEKKYARRQMTWFKRDKRIKWLKDYKEMQTSCNKFLQ